MPMENDDKVIAAAKDFLKSHQRELIERFCDPLTYYPDSKPVSLFMAGSPGAGKTEVSKRLIEKFSSKPVRIDADDIRSIFPDYNGHNAYLFQAACSLGVNKLYDYVLEQNLGVILDGTFAYRGALSNIQRSVDHGRKVEIYYVYQDPLLAWQFTQRREEREGRNVPRSAFIRGFITARENVNMVKQKFGDRIEVNVIVKNFSTGLERYESNVDSVDQFLGKLYSRSELEGLIL